MKRKRKNEKPEVHSVVAVPKRVKALWFWVPSMLNKKGKKIDDSVECWFSSDYYSSDESVDMAKSVWHPSPSR